jgi:hypothetical protein
VIVTGGPQAWETKGVIRSLSSDTLVLDAKGSRMSRRIRGTRDSPSEPPREKRCNWGWNRFLAYCIGAGTAKRQNKDLYGWAYVGSWLLPATGASVGAATGGSKTVFLPAGRVGRGTSISPWVAPSGAGLALAIRY